ncbi:MAG TPA: hypothetical protein VM408_02605 [Methylomirabilota bacterium]|nr:hypothetical protein [Methylomirabilota bacterium]
MATATNPTSSADSGSEASGQRLSDAASSVATHAERAVDVKASGAMHQASGTLHEVADAIRTAGENLRTEQPQIQGFADTAARQVERAATYLEDHEPRELLDEVQAIARRQPALVIGGGLAVGLALGRLLRTAGSTGTQSQYGMARYGMAGNGASSGTPSAYRSPVGPGSTSNAGNRSSAETIASDPSTSVIASARTVDVGSETDTGRSGDAPRS